MKKLSQEQFINKSKEAHNNFYDYSLSEYNGVHTKITIICSIHGNFKQIPLNHFKGVGCPDCGYKKCQISNTKSIDNFIESSNIIHNNKYNYSKSNYVNAITKIVIMCPKHGDFLQKPDHHLAGFGCKKCTQKSSKAEKRWLNQLNITEQSRQQIIIINNRKYIVDAYVTSTNTIYEFLGDFWHGNLKRFNREDYNMIAKKTFGDLYDKTIERIKTLEECGYNVVSMWEYDFKVMEKLNARI